MRLDFVVSFYLAWTVYAAFSVYTFFYIFLTRQQPKHFENQPVAAARSLETELKLKKKRAEVIFLIMEKLETSMCIWKARNRKDGIRRQTTPHVYCDVNSIVFVFIVALCCCYFLLFCNNEDTRLILLHIVNVLLLSKPEALMCIRCKIIHRKIRIRQKL